MKKRENCFDSLKYFCILLVMNAHFLLFFYRPIKDFWKDFPYNLFLYGLDGKLGVSIFAVITGYFAYLSGKKKRSFFRYLIRRYSYFLICALLINSILYFLNIRGVRSENSFGLVVGQSILLDRLIFETYWFVRPFLFGSLLAFLFGRYDVGIPIIVVLIPILVCFNDPFFLTYAADCLLGCVLSYLLDLKTDLYRNRWFQFVIVIGIYVFVKRDSSNLTYLIQGLIGVALILLIRNNDFLYHLSENRFTAFFGRMTMPLVLSHMLCLYLFEIYLYSLKEHLFLVFLIWFALSHLTAIMFDAVINYIVKSVNSVIDGLLDRFDGLKAGQK